MNFFQQLYEQLDGIGLSLIVKRKNGKLTLSILPETVDKISPVIITGTPEELNEGFFEAIKAPIEAVKGLNVHLANMDDSIKQVKEKKEADLKKAEIKPVVKPASKSTTKTKKVPPKPKEKVEKKETMKPVKKEEAIKPAVPDLFANV